MKSDLLSEEDCTKILQNRFKNNKIQFVSYELKGISGNVEGFLGEHYNLLITYKIGNEENTEIFFLKTKPTNTEVQKKIALEYDAFNKEIFIYDILIKEFEKYGFDTSFSGKCYLCIPNQSLIFENLVHKGFQLPAKLVPFELDEIKSVLKCLALFHAAGLAYQETKIKELGNFDFSKHFADFMEERIFTFYTRPNEENTIIRTWWKSCFRTINKVIELLPESENYKTEFKELFNSYPFGKIFIDKTKFAKTCGHGDLWSNNMLFKYDGNKVVDARLLDFQLGRYFYPSFDVILIIFVNTTAEFRKVYLNELYQYYYSILKDTITNYGCSMENIMPEKDFYESLKITMPEGLLQTLCAIQFLGLPQETLNNSVAGEGEGMMEIIKDNVELTCNVFTKNFKYRKMISEAMCNLRDALVQMK